MNSTLWQPKSKRRPALALGCTRRKWVGDVVLKNREDNILWKTLLYIQRFILVVAGAVTVLITFGAAATRFVGINFAGWEELLVFSAFWLYMMGCAYGSYEKSHITADILGVMMKDSLAKSIIMLLRSIISLALCAIFLSWAWSMFTWTFGLDARTPVYRAPVAIGQASVVIGLALNTFYFAVYLYDEVKLFVAKHIKKQPVEAAEGQGGSE